MFFLKESLNTIKITPKRIKTTPKTIFKVIVSENNKTPKNIAVKGSNAPIIAVVVEPTSRIAIFIVSKDIIVGKTANAIAQAKTFQSLIGCNWVQNFKLKIKTLSPKSIT